MRFKLFVFILFTSLFFIKSSAQSSPLIQMQKDYDAVKLKIASATFEINCLAADNKRASFIKNIGYEKLHELDSALTVTKNYRAADLKLKELLRVFEDDPEKNAIENNYNEFKDAEKIRLDLIKSNSITLTEFELWKKNVLEKYKSVNGANFKGYLGTYNSMSDIILNL